MTSPRLILHLALQEMRTEWRAALCFVAALIAILAPLLLLLALKNGVVENMVDRLVEDPSNREILATQAQTHGPAFFDAMEARADVAFVIPRTRSINTQAEAVRNPVTRALVRAVTLIPSKAGDPLVSGPPVARGQVYLTERLAQDIGWEAGQPVTLFMRRNLNGALQPAEAQMEVLGVIPARVLNQEAMFLSLPDLIAVERFLDDETVTSETWMEDRPLPEVFASFRLYVRDLGDLDQVTRDLERDGVTVRPKARNAIILLDFRANVNLLYTAIAIIAAIGFWAAMAANLRGMVERQRETFSLLRLLGFSTWSRRALPLVQGQLLVFLGVVASLLLVLPVLLVVNRVFAQQDTGIATLSGADMILTLCLGLLLALASSFWALLAVQDIGAEEVLRNG